MYISESAELLQKLAPNLLDPLGEELAKNVEWWELEGLNESPKSTDNLYPVAVIGSGEPLILLHGFDSCFLEFRRLVPLLKAHHQIIIPDLYGFGFCPRPLSATYGKDAMIKHLNSVIKQIPNTSNIGLIGASMGGAIAMEMARQQPEKISRILLLSPAGLTGKPTPIPRLLDRIGVWILSRPEVRKRLCKLAFDNPTESVGEAEEQIASLHLKVPRWSEALASFARSGGIASLGRPLPKQPFQALWGANDRILKGQQKKEALELLTGRVKELKNCGHLPHLDRPKAVAEFWLNGAHNNEEVLEN